MEDQGCRRDPEADAAVVAAEPLDDVVEIEDQLAPPVAAGNVADLEAQAVDRVVVPRQAREIGVRDPLLHHATFWRRRLRKR